MWKVSDAITEFTNLYIDSKMITFVLSDHQSKEKIFESLYKYDATM